MTKVVWEIESANPKAPKDVAEIGVERKAWVKVVDGKSSMTNVTLEEARCLPSTPTRSLGPPGNT